MFDDDDDDDDGGGGGGDGGGGDGGTGAGRTVKAMVLGMQAASQVSCIYTTDIECGWWPGVGLYDIADANVVGTVEVQYGATLVMN